MWDCKMGARSQNHMQDKGWKQVLTELAIFYYAYADEYKSS